MTTLNKALNVVDYVNKRTTGTTSYAVTDYNEMAFVNFVFQPLVGLPAFSTLIVTLVPNYSTLPDDQLELTVAYDGTKYQSSFAPDGSSFWFLSPMITIPPKHGIEITDASGNKIAVTIVGTKLKNFS